MLRRIVPTTAAALLVVAGLSGCSTQQATASDCSTVLQPGVLSDTVVVLGGFGEMPQITAPDDAQIAATQRTVVTEAAERTKLAETGSIVGVNMAFFDADTDEPLYASPAFSDGAASPEYLLLDDQQVNPLSEAVRCAAPGDRVVLALSPSDTAQLATQLGKPEATAIVAVLDVETVGDSAASGRVHGLPNGYPAIVTNEDGRPGMVLPPTEAPTTSSSALRITGDGPKVTAEDGVFAQVLQVGWDGSVLMNSWETGITSLGTEAQIPQSTFTFRTALTGKPVGSQVVVIQGSADGTPQVVVVDILGVS